MTGLAISGAVAALAAAINAGAGGGSFISFPTLVFLGVPPINANATNTAAMWLGQAGSMHAFRDDLGRPSVRFIAAMAVSVVGGISGAVLLLHTPQHLFDAVIPWLLLLSTLLFAFAPSVMRLLRRAGETTDVGYHSLVPLFAIAVYGGYFGGGQGLMLLAYFALIGMTDLRRMNGMKSILTFINNGVPVIPFVLARALAWDVAVAMCLGAILGGYYGARLVRIVHPRYLRPAIVSIGLVMTVVFFLRSIR